MYIKYTDLTDNFALIHLPESAVWTIKTLDVSSEGDETCSLVLACENKMVCLLDGEWLTGGRPSLPNGAVLEYYRAIAGEIFGLIKDFPNLSVLDLDEIAAGQLQKFEKVWAEKGYITLDEDGSW